MTPRRSRRQGWQCGCCAGLGLVGVEVGEQVALCQQCGGSGFGRAVVDNASMAELDGMTMLGRAIIRLLLEPQADGAFESQLSVGPIQTSTGIG